jgi:hypothetical protein
MDLQLFLLVSGLVVIAVAAPGLMLQAEEWVARRREQERERRGARRS